MTLRSKLLVRFCLGLVIAAALLFIPAGSGTFWQGWTFIAIIFALGVLSSFYLYNHDPKLVERRFQAKEKIREQRFLVRLLRPLIVAVLVLPGLDYAPGSRAPTWAGCRCGLLAL